MGQTIRFGVSMDSALVALLDQLTEQRGAANRSETIRELVRAAVIEESLGDEERHVIGTLTLLFHHQTRLPRAPISDYPSLTITANLQFHIHGEICVKLLMVRGSSGDVNKWAAKLLGHPDVIGNLSICATDALLGELVRPQ